MAAVGIRVVPDAKDRMVQKSDPKSIAMESNMFDHSIETAH